MGACDCSFSQPLQCSFLLYSQSKREATWRINTSPLCRVLDPAWPQSAGRIHECGEVPGSTPLPNVFSLFHRVVTYFVCPVRPQVNLSSARQRCCPRTGLSTGTVSLPADTMEKTRQALGRSPDGQAIAEFWLSARVVKRW